MNVILEIDVIDAPKITPVEFLRQIIENIQSQISSIDEEVSMACQTNNPEVCIRRSIFTY
jgi:hypothetical protein